MSLGLALVRFESEPIQGLHNLLRDRTSEADLRRIVQAHGRPRLRAVDSPPLVIVLEGIPGRAGHGTPCEVRNLPIRKTRACLR